MINNAKPDKIMRQIMEEVESGDSIYTPQQEREIEAIMYEAISKGENFERIYEKKLKDQYPLPKGPGLVNSHIKLRQIYADTVQKYKKAVSIDKEHLFDEVYSRLEEIYWQEVDKHDIEGQRKVLMQLKDLIKHALSEKALNQAKDNDGETTYVLDFNI